MPREPSLCAEVSKSFKGPVLSILSLNLVLAAGLSSLVVLRPGSLLLKGHTGLKQIGAVTINHSWNIDR